MRRRRRQRGREGAEAGLKIALVGNPNVGKSCLFNQLTGLGVQVANYPGTTVEVYSGRTSLRGMAVEITDLPGVYAISGNSPEETIVRDFLSKETPDAVINVVDSNLLDRNLYLTLQLFELGLPVVVGLNFYEECGRQGIAIDHRALERKLGVPVVPLDALRGAGIAELMDATIAAAHEAQSPVSVGYDDHIENAISVIMRLPGLPEGTLTKSFAMGLLEGEKEAWRLLDGYPGVSREVKDIMSRAGTHDLPVEIAKERHGQAALIADSVKTRNRPVCTPQERMDRVTTGPVSGFLVMLGVLALIFLSLFLVGGFLEGLINDFFAAVATPALTSLINTIPNDVAQTTLQYAIIWGLQAGLSIAVPYILVFYLLMAFLEDTGYLPRMGYLMDRFMHKIGLHGRAILPMMLGFGCTVPAIISTRLLESRRERLITAILISFIPCSARTAIILGAVGFYIGWQYALSIYAVLLLLMFAAGVLLKKWLPGEQEGLIMEMPRYRRPQLTTVMKKALVRVKDFVYIAFPLLIIGSGLLGLLEGMGLLRAITAPFDPIMSGWLMLPPMVGIALIYGILRKEMALATLLVLAGTPSLLLFMTPLQIYVFALVTAIYVPCVATIGVLAREFGWRSSLLISFATIFIAFLIGGLVARILPALGILS